jgi:hypothetical protein
VQVVYPGGVDEPGSRDIDIESHLNFPRDTSGVIPFAYYNFQHDIGSVLGVPAFNLITQPQKQRFREIMAYWSHYLGVQFVEVPDANVTSADPAYRGNFTLATGDMRAIGGSVASGISGVAGGFQAILSSSFDWGSSEHGGLYFQVAAQLVGHLMGLGYAGELPPYTLIGQRIAESTPGVPNWEHVFPGDADITLGQYLHPPVGNDINMYKFALDKDGVLNIETFAQRIRDVNPGLDPSKLDTVISVYDSNKRLIARNDDYFGHDSFVELSLKADTYYIGITSTGNTDFDPTIPDTGLGGTTQGGYQLRLTFKPVQTVGIKDTSGTLLDGDDDGVAGGVHSFWFNASTTNANNPGVVANTLYVDKTTTGTTGTVGSLARPYAKISDALGAATPGTIVRVVGNGGADANLATVADNQSYNIGFDNLNRPLSDGSKLDVPEGVTLISMPVPSSNCAPRTSKWARPRSASIAAAGRCKCWERRKRTLQGPTLEVSTSPRTTTLSSAPIPTRPRGHSQAATGAVWCSATTPPWVLPRKSSLPKASS